MCMLTPNNPPTTSINNQPTTSSSNHQSTNHQNEPINHQEPTNPKIMGKRPSEGGGSATTSSSPPPIFVGPSSPCEGVRIDLCNNTHSRIHHHHRHHHSIYSRGNKISSSDLNRPCCKHKRSSSCSTNVFSTATSSPGRKLSVKGLVSLQSTPPPPAIGSVTSATISPLGQTNASTLGLSHALIGSASSPSSSYCVVDAKAATTADLCTDGAVQVTSFNRLSPVPLSPSRGGDSPSSFNFDNIPYQGRTEVDYFPKEMSFGYIDMMAIFFSICSFMFDIGTDSVVACYHFRNEDYWYFGLTLAFILIPTLVVTGISLRWYVLDSREEGSPPISRLQWVMRVIFLLFQLGPIIRYFDSLMYGLKFRKSKQRKNVVEQKKYFQYMIYEDTDATMLRLFESFMEAAPQLVLQMYIIARKKTAFSDQDPLFAYVQVAAVAASLLSLSWSLVSYNRALRMSLPDKINMTWQGLVVQFFRRIGMVASRVLALALFASKYPLIIGLVCMVHWLIMFIWIITMRTSFCDNKCEELGYNAVLAVMFIFCYFNPVDSPTRFRYIGFDSFMFIQNTTLMALFYLHPDSKDLWYRTPALIGYFMAFFWGISFMIIYYVFFHPTASHNKNGKEYPKDRTVICGRSYPRK